MSTKSDAAVFDVALEGLKIHLRRRLSLAVNNVDLESPVRDSDHNRRQHVAAHASDVTRRDATIEP